MTLKILYDAGHGYGKAHNRGALVGNEGDNNFYFGNEFKKALEQYEGVVVDFSRKRIEDNPTPFERAKGSEAYDLFYSGHSNFSAKSSVRGVEIIEDINTDDGGLASKLCKTLAPFFGGVNRGVKWRKLSGEFLSIAPAKDERDYYGVLRYSKAKSSMLVEHGFHGNAEDARAYVEKRQEIAEAEAATIAKHYGLKKKTAAVSPAPTPTTPAAPKPTTTTTKTKATLKVDGYMGPATIKALQRYLGTPVDGVLSKPSLVIKELQRRLNKGQL